jgi:deoxyribodipyrimidine photolyase
MISRRACTATITHLTISASKSPSYLSVHLRLGTTSIRSLLWFAFDAMRAIPRGEGARRWLSEPIWRDFYRWGERYFAGKLIDYDLAANNGGWQ